MPIKMIKQDAQILVINPYLARVSNYLKNLGNAKWDASQQGWLIDADFENEISQKLIKTFGSDGSTEVETVSAYVTFIENKIEKRKPIGIAGLVFSRANGRDGGATTGEGVALLEGEISSGGSAKNWESIVREGAKFKVTKLIKTLIKDLEKVDGIELEIINQPMTKSKSISTMAKYKDEELLEECKKRGLLNSIENNIDNGYIKYSKDQNSAVEALIMLAKGVAEKTLVTLTETEVTLIKNVFGINLWEITLAQNIVNKYIQGKTNPLLEIAFRSKSNSDVHMSKRYFEFQVKETKQAHFNFGKSLSIEDLFKQHIQSGELKTEKEFYNDSLKMWELTGYSELAKVEKSFEYSLASATRVARISQIELDVIEAVKKQISS
jgi:hypothetical protein